MARRTKLPTNCTCDLCQSVDHMVASCPVLHRVLSSEDKALSPFCSREWAFEQGRVHELSKLQASIFLCSYPAYQQPYSTDSPSPLQRRGHWRRHPCPSAYRWRTLISAEFILVVLPFCKTVLWWIQDSKLSTVTEPIPNKLWMPFEAC